MPCRGIPRILIGGGLWKYLADGLVEFESRKTPELDKICNVIRKSKEFMAIDSDGRRILDYMGAFYENDFPAWCGGESDIASLQIRCRGVRCLDQKG